MEAGRPDQRLSPHLFGALSGRQAGDLGAGYDRVSKLDAATLEVLTTYAIGGNTFFGPDEVERQVAVADRIDKSQLAGYFSSLIAEAWPSVGSAYKLLSRDNELYIAYHAPDGTKSLRVYGEVDNKDPASRIVLRREWKLPAEISKSPLCGMQITQDGWIVLTTADGLVTALARDFSAHHTLRLPSKNGEWPVRDFFSSFVRNGAAADDQGGIYVVTRDYLHRVQWTGSKLSIDEADGGWSVPYPNQHGRGSGTTPGLMGWGPNEDHLVIIGDGNNSNNAMAYWRDAIPADWQGLPGYDRRVAGVTPIHFGVSRDEQVQTENAPIVYGYGAFFNNTYPAKHLPDQGGPTRQWMAESLQLNVPGHEALGGAMIGWDSKARALKTVWQSQANFGGAVCTVSSATKLLYCWGARNGEWTLEGTDWASGKNVFHYALGSSQRYSPIGGTITIAPNGAVDCACLGGLGLARAQPKQPSGKRK